LHASEMTFTVLINYEGLFYGHSMSKDKSSSDVILILSMMSTGNLVRLV